MSSSPDRRRRGHDTAGARLQTWLGWAAFGVVFAGVLWNGAANAVAWTFLCLAIFVLFAAQVALDIAHGLPRAARAGVWLAVPYALVLAWLQIQLTPGLAAQLAHPVWALAPDGAAPTMSAAPDEGRKVIARLSCYAMVFWICLRGAGAARDGAMGQIRAVAVFSTLLALYGLFSAAAGYNLLLGNVPETGVVRASLWNRNSYATVAVIGALANVTAYVAAVSNRARRDGLAGLRDHLEAFFSTSWIFAFGALVGLAGLAMTLSRGGAAAGIVAMVVLVLALRRGTRTANRAALAIPVALVVFVIAFMSSGVVDRFNALDSGARLEIYARTLAGIGDRPLVGHGAGAFQDAFRAYMQPGDSPGDWEKAHDTYLENAFEFGLPAALVLFATLGFVGWRLLAGVRLRRRHHGAPAFALACLIAGAVHSVVDFSLQIPAIAALFAAILGIGWAQSFATRRTAVNGAGTGAGTRAGAGTAAGTGAGAGAGTGTGTGTRARARRRG